MNKLQIAELFMMMKVYYPRDFAYMDEKTVKCTIKVLYDVFQSYDPKTIKSAFEELAKEEPSKAPTIPQLQNKADEIEKEVMFKMLKEKYQDKEYIYDTKKNVCIPNMNYFNLQKLIKEGIHLPEFKKCFEEKEILCQKN